VHYWSLFDNKILRQFKGHSGAVTSMHMCPADDTFLTCSNDRTVRLWNIQQAGGVAELKFGSEKEETEGTPMAQYDSTGLVIAISTMMKNQAGHHLHMYDARNYQAGAFAELKVLRTDVETAIAQHVNVAVIPPANVAGLGPCVWKSLQFNKGGDRLLVRAEKGLTLLLDGFDGTVQKAFCTGRPTARDAVACFASDDKTVLQGNDDGSITCWDIDTGMNIRTLSGHIGPVSCLASNPKYTQLASSCSQTALWIW
jgi:WD40 repeat protein